MAFRKINKRLFTNHRRRVVYFKPRQFVAAVGGENFQRRFECWRCFAGNFSITHQTMTFEELLKLKYGVLFSGLDCHILRVINDEYYKISEHKYIAAYEAENLGEIIYCGFVWIASDAVAEWIFTGNSPADDAVNISPPKCLLPQSSITDYQSLIEYGKKADPENFSDCVIGSCRISFNDFTYYFGKAMPSENDFPAAIEVDLRPWKNLKAA